MRNKPVVWHLDFLYIYLGSTFVVNLTFKFFLQAHVHHSPKLSMYRVSCHMARDSSSGQTSLSENYSVLADYCFTVGYEGERVSKFKCCERLYGTVMYTLGTFWVII